MDCGSGVCQSGCSEVEVELEDFPRTSGRDGQPRKLQQNMCVKCKNKRSNHGSCRVHDSLCSECFRSYLYGKFRHAVTSNSMITPSDNILIAFSGGYSSRVALQFVHAMQTKAQNNLDASRHKSLLVPGVGVAFIDETAFTEGSAGVIDEVIQSIKFTISDLQPPSKKLLIVPVESVYSLHPSDRKERLRKLLGLVNDPTGKEDLQHHIRMLCLQKVASENGYNKLIVGSCITKLTCHVISTVVKGKGHSLPADIQYVDARWKIPVCLPLRDCTSDELRLLCDLDGLEYIPSLDTPRGINALVSSFVALLQEDNPYRERSIMKTAGKLTPFHFNRIPETMNRHQNTSSKEKRCLTDYKESIQALSFCFICSSPISDSNRTILDGSEPAHNRAVCANCRFQTVPNDSLSRECFWLQLPEGVDFHANNASSLDPNAPEGF